MNSFSDPDLDWNWLYELDEEKGLFVFDDELNGFLVAELELENGLLVRFDVVLPELNGFLFTELPDDAKGFRVDAWVLLLPKGVRDEVSLVPPPLLLVKGLLEVEEDPLLANGLLLELLLL